MSKRFTDTCIWQKQWFRKLAPSEKAAWFYLLSACDAVGVWDGDLELAEFSIGQKVDWEALRTAANGNIEVLDNGKWWVVDFISYQYGEVKKVSSSKVQQHLSLLLEKHDLTERYFATVAPTVKDKDKDKDLDKDKDKIKRQRANLVTTDDREHGELVGRFGEPATQAAYAKLSAYKLSSGKTYKSDYGAILHWVMGEVQKTGKYAKPSSVPKVEPPPCPKCGRQTIDYDDHSWACHGCKRFFDKATMDEENIVAMVARCRSEK